MAKLHRMYTHDGLTSLAFHCPGCHNAHYVRVNESGTRDSRAWEWNGSMDAPTFSPSILTWTPTPTQDRCHSFVRDGRIVFLTDCHHALKATTVDIPDWED